MEINLLRLSKKEIVIFLILSGFLGSGLSYGKLYLYHIVLFCAAGVFIFFNLTKVNFSNMKSNHHIIFPIIFIWYAFSILWSPDRLNSVTYLGYISLGIIFTYTIIFYNGDEKSLRLLFNLCSFLFIAEIILGVTETTGLFRWPISPYSPLVTYFGKEKGFDLTKEQKILSILMRMPTGFRWNPNNYATTLNILLPFIIFIKKRIRFALISVILFLIIMDGSRGSIITYFIILLVYLILYKKKGWKSFTAITSLMTKISIITFDFLKRSTNNKIQLLFNVFQALKLYLFNSNESIGSISTRTRLIRNGMDALYRNYGLGIGGGASNFIQKQAGNTRGITSMHNFWIEILVEGGIIFFLIFVIWYIKMVRDLIIISKRSANPFINYLAKSISLSLIGFVFGAISPSTVIYFFPMWGLFGFAISVINLYRVEIIYENNSFI